MRATTHVDGKPFGYPELRARGGGAAALRRRALPAWAAARRRARGRHGARVVRVRGTPVELSHKEFALVRTLASDPTRVFTKAAARYCQGPGSRAAAARSARCRWPARPA